MRSQRQLKVGEEIRHAIAMMIQRGDVPWPKDFMPPMITISEVQISPDLQNASAFFTTVGGERTGEAKKVLNSLAGFFRHELAKAVRLRYVPRLEFKVDNSFEYATKIDRILSDPDVAKDLKEKGGEPLSEDRDE